MRLHCERKGMKGSETVDHRQWRRQVRTPGGDDSGVDLAFC